MLDGGFVKWKREKRALSKETEKSSYKRYKGIPNSSLLVNSEEIKNKIKQNKNIQIIDSRTSKEFSGEHVRACRGGHIPFSTNIDWITNVKNGSFRTISELKKIYGNFSRENDIITYCHGGYRAANTFVILREVGFKKAKMYLGSWNEWGNNHSLPIDY
jgi:thiosulfate/3-mercaptopyruvate sulfurtransferase